MTSRDLVLKSIAHIQPSALPLDIGATPSSGISAIAYNNLRKKLGIYDGKAKIYDVVQQVAQPDDDILSRFRADVLDIGTAFNTEKNNWRLAELSDGSHALYPAWFNPVRQKDGSDLVFDSNKEAIAKMPVGATFFDQLIFPYIDGYPANYKKLGTAMNKVMWQYLPISPFDHSAGKDFFKTLRTKTLELRTATDKALMISCGCNLFEWGTFLRRMDNFLMDIYTEPEEVNGLLDALMERHLAFLTKICESVGDIVDIVRFGDDLGMDTGPFMSPEKYREIFHPRHKMLCDFTHKHSKMKTFLHSCGSIYKLMPDLISAGFDIINPVQTSSNDMDPIRLKKEFGKEITFWGGGCNTRNILNRSTPDEVYSHTLRMIDIFFKDGGFVFNQEHNIMPDVPPENIIAMYRAVAKYK